MWLSTYNYSEYVGRSVHVHLSKILDRRGIGFSILWNGNWQEIINHVKYNSQLYRVASTLY